MFIKYQIILQKQYISKIISYSVFQNYKEYVDILYPYMTILAMTFKNQISKEVSIRRISSQADITIIPL